MCCRLRLSGDTALTHLNLPVVCEVQVRVMALCLRNLLHSVEEVNGCSSKSSTSTHCEYTHLSTTTTYQIGYDSEGLPSDARSDEARHTVQHMQVASGWQDRCSDLDADPPSPVSSCSGTTPPPATKFFATNRLLMDCCSSDSCQLGRHAISCGSWSAGTVGVSLQQHGPGSTTQNDGSSMDP